MNESSFGNASFSVNELNDIACSGRAMEYIDAIVLIHASDFIELYDPSECLRKAIDILDNKQRTPDEEFLLGYAWYHLPEDKADPVVRNEAVEAHLRKSLESGEGFRNYFYAKELLGCQYYDIGQYEAALSVFSTFENDTFLKNFDQKWKDVKIAELRLCCILRLKRVAKIKVSIECIYDIFEMLINDVNPNNGRETGPFVSLAHPSELIDTLKVCLESVRNSTT